jgi:glycerophosphoryl diester phosphodiesterase
VAAFRHAVEVGADFIELDLAVTRDDVIVVAHDPVLDPRLCTAPPGACVRKLAFCELLQWDFGARRHPRFPRQTPVPGSRIVTLDEALALGARTGVQFNLEVKSFPDRPEYAPPPDRYATLLLEAVRRRGVESRVMVQSFDFRILHEMRALAPEIRLTALYGPGLRDFVAVARAAGTDTVAPHHRLVTARRVRAAHEAGLEVVCWTANTPKQWARLVRAGVDGIITDDPAGLILYLRDRGLR